MSLMNEQQMKVSTVSLTACLKTLQETYLSKVDYGFTALGYRPKTGKGMALVIQRYREGLSSLSMMTLVRLSGNNNELYLKDRNLSTCNLAEQREQLSVKYNHQTALIDELSLLKTYFQHTESANTYPHFLSWGQSCLRDKQTSYRDTLNLLLGLMGIEQDEMAQELYAKLWDLLQL